MSLSYFRKSIAAAFMLLATFIAPLFANHAMAETLGIAAIVNDEVISLYDLNSRITLLITSAKQQDSTALRKRLARQVLNRLIDEKLKMQEAKKLGINVAKKDMEKAFRGMERRNKFPIGGLDSFLSSVGLHKMVLLEQIEAEIAWTRVVNRSFRPRIVIGDDEIDEIVAEIVASKGKPEYLMSEIFISVDKPEAIAEAEALANRLLEQLRGGASFSALAQNYSQSASSAVGGDMGWVHQGQLSRELNIALTKLDDNAVSPPIRTIAGLYILMKRNTRIGKGLVSGDEKVKLHQVFLPLSASATEPEIASQMELASTMAESANNCTDMDKLGKESGSQFSGDLGEVKTSSLPEATRQIVDKLKVSEASAPQRTDNGVIILMVCERTGSSALQSVREEIENRLMNERLEVSARSFIRDLRRTAFVDIRI